MLFPDPIFKLHNGRYAGQVIQPNVAAWLFKGKKEFFYSEPSGQEQACPWWC